MRPVLLVLFALLPAVGMAQPLRIGSKQFTESVILAEIARGEAHRAGLDVEHRRELGGTAILWSALQHGDIDAYPEYTGTLTQELLKGIAPDAGIKALRERLAPMGIGITDSLGFDDNYAIGMREQRAAALGIQRISDLAAHPDLHFGFSNEFMDRGDGWPGLRQRYGLAPTHVQGLDHALSYRALASGAVDLTDLYSTDAEIAYYHLRVLQDDRHYFPRYQAVFLYRLALEHQAPGFVAALKSLAGHIDEPAMRRMNAQAKIERQREADIAAGFLHLPIDGQGDGFWRRLWHRTAEHVSLAATSLALAVWFAIPLGIVAARWRRLGQWVIGLTGVLQTVPSLAMFVFMIPLFGIGAWPALAALFLYSLLPIVRNTHAGLLGIPLELRESAAALGLPWLTRLHRVELPLAARSILAGIKTASVINVGTATLAALIGAGGYGQPILTGIRLNDVGLILEGAVPAALLAIVVQLLFEGIERRLTPRGLRIVARE